MKPDGKLSELNPAEIALEIEQLQALAIAKAIDVTPADDDVFK